MGIGWQGSKIYHGDRFRSIPLAAFAPLAQVAGVRLISLQKGADAAELAGVGFPVEDLGSRLDNEGHAFRDTAAVIANLDLVITSDTALAHLAGALGARVWVALRACLTGLADEWRGQPLVSDHAAVPPVAPAIGRACSSGWRANCRLLRHRNKTHAKAVRSRSEFSPTEANAPWSSGQVAATATDF